MGARHARTYGAASTGCDVYGAVAGANGHVGRSAVTRRMRLIGAGALAAVVLIGAFVTVRLVANHIDSTIPQGDLFGSPSPGSDIEGPLDILIVGEDTRSSSGTAPHNDADMILHVSEDLASAYLTSLPRDLLVDIPAFAPSGSRAMHTKLTHAMTFGSKVSGGYDTRQGFQLVFQTISGYTGIDAFDAGVLFSFAGMDTFVDKIGGIDIYVDETTRSIHRQPNGQMRPLCGACANGYGGPQAVYQAGMQHLVGWQALDFARQRYGLNGGAYGRERHHRQIVRAVMAQLFKQDLVLNPAKADAILKAVGRGVIFDGRGRPPSEFGYALRNLRPENVTLIGLPGTSVYSGGGYIGESLNTSIKNSYFEALRNDQLDTWVHDHANLVNKSEP
jgi:polyisoprenyl-teichoic acid--peptidoglycan teichoic acid transferase